MSQARQLVLVVVHRHQLLNVGEVGHVESVWRTVLGLGPVRKLSVHIPEGECGGVSSTAATLSTKIGMLVRGLIPISVNKWVDVPAEVKEYIMDRVLDHFDLDYTRHEDHQLAKARDEIEAMRAAREKDLQEFAKKQAEMEATLRDHREEQRVEQERIRLEQEERMKKAHASGARGAHAKEQSACERSKSAYRQKYRRNWRRKCPL
ncbi:hypothetical protein CJ030_MR7G021998 [Morella rubra]|uniref:Uncharacterized protein n=1 Tax=Morella rubra TaxID=262757 RepID=A0A6A1UXJ8_9ROSI|nr:hypothetical protein CJ030_MR7G021998 [Morella rubra]